MSGENKNLLCSWSGGKDSCYALMKAIEIGYTPKVLLNVLNEEGKISRSHGIPINILQAQADAIGIPLYTIVSSWNNYEENFTNALINLKAEYDLDYAVFGDIDLQAHRDWEEKVCAKANLEALLPLWQQDRVQLVREMLEHSIETMIISCNNSLGTKTCGIALTNEVVLNLLAQNIDPCGENGEFHTLVTNCSLYKEPLLIKVLKAWEHENYCFSELSLLQ
jgi:diphthine-ammonia ligase